MGDKTRNEKMNRDMDFYQRRNLHNPRVSEEKKLKILILNLTVY